jgi:two-component system response regulator FixJ
LTAPKSEAVAVVDDDDGARLTAPKSEAVAVVDDDDGALQSMRFLLEVMGHTVVTFSSAADFLRAELQHIACLMLDQHMPGMSGLELVERLRSKGVTIPIMLITGALSPAIAAKASHLGVARVLEKPPQEDEILAFIALAGRCP